MGRKRRKPKREPSKRPRSSHGQTPSPKQVEPDEFEEIGPIRIARFGRITVMQNTMDEAAHAEVMRRAAEDYPIVCEEISTEVATAIEIVSSVHPLDLLRRAYKHLAHSMLGAAPEESKATSEQIIARQLLDYIQKLVCAVGSDEEKPLITDEQYRRLFDLVSQMYHHFKFRFYFDRQAVLRQQSDYDADRDDFSVMSEGLWMLLQGDRHAYHLPIYLRDLLAEHERQLEEAFGVSLEDIDRGVRAIQRSLSTGLFRSFEVLHQVQQQLPDPSEVEGEFDFGQFLEQHGVADPDSPLSTAIESISTFRLFDVPTLTGWPETFARALSVKVGTDSGFVSHAERGGWPTQPSQCDIFPFVEFEGTPYVFNEAHFRDVTYRAIERALLDANPGLRSDWNARQRRTSEALALRLITNVLQGAEVLSSIYYPVLDESTGTSSPAECDGLIIYDNNLLVVEVKGGAFSTKSPAVHPKAHVDALKKLVGDPIEQARRFVRELQARGTVEVSDKRGRVLRTVSDNFDSIALICVTVDQLTNLSPQIEHLRLIGVDSSELPAWPVSLDDLRVITEVLANPIDFMNFIEQRLRAFSSPAVRMIDELDHLGAYLEHNMYAKFAEQADAPMGWHGYCNESDRYYHALFAGVEDPMPPQQEMPPCLRDILDLMARERCAGFVSAGKLLLDGDEESRKALCDMINETKRLQAIQGRPRPASLIGSWPITVFSNTDDAFSVDFSYAKMHACADLQITGGEYRLVLLLDFSQDETLRNVEFELLTPGCGQEIGEDKLRPVRHRLFQARRRQGR